MKKVIVAFVSTFLCATVSAGPAGVVKIWNPAEGGAASGTVKVDGLNSTMIGAIDRQDGFGTNLTVYSQARVITSQYGYTFTNLISGLDMRFSQDGVVKATYSSGGISFGGPPVITLDTGAVQFRFADFTYDRDADSTLEIVNYRTLTNALTPRLGQLGFNGSLAFISSNVFLPFGSASLVPVFSQGITGTPATGTFEIPKDGWYSLHLTASWESGGADVYYGSFSSNGTEITYGQAADETKNANDDGHLSTFYYGYFTNGTDIGVMVKSDNEQGGTLLDYLFGVKEIK